MNGFIFVCLIVLLFIIYIWSQPDEQQHKSRPKLDRSLDNKLLGMLNGDHQLALRLLRHARRNNPNRSYLWYHEKVIRDLERDRRY